MRRFAVPLCLLVLAPAACLAQPSSVPAAGGWNAFSERDDKGGAVCGIVTVNPADDGRMMIRLSIGGSDTSFVVSKPSWAIPAGTGVLVVMQVGLTTPILAHATGSAQTITWTMDLKAFRAFDIAFRSDSLLTITFPEGNEPPWMLPLGGSAAAGKGFDRCIQELTSQVRRGAAKLPSDPPAHTQPFGPLAGH